MPYPPIKLTRKWRLTIMISLILLFFILAPTIILYTAGYRYNFEKDAIQKTGVISIQAKPESAQVYLNDVKLDKELPIRLSNRAPGTYQIKIKKSGYITWEKNIQVKSRKTTYINQIQLIKDTLPVKLNLGINFAKVTKTKLSPQYPYAIVVVKKNNYSEVKLVDLKQKEITSLIRTPHINNKSPKILWSDTRPFGYIVTYPASPNKPKVQLFTAKRSKISKPIFTIKGSHQKNIQLLDTNSAKIIANTPKGITKFTINNSSAITTSTKQLSTWFYNSNTNKLWYYDEDLNRLKQKGEQKFLPIEDNLSNIITLDKNKIIAKNKQDQIIVYVRDGNNITKKNKLPATKTTKIDSTWIAYSDWQFWRIQTNGNVELMLRSKPKIKSVQKLEKIGSRNNLVIHKNTKIKTFDPRYYTNHTLFQNGQILDVGVSPEDRRIYLRGKIGNQTGIFYREF